MTLKRLRSSSPAENASENPTANSELDLDIDISALPQPAIKKAKTSHSAPAPSVASISKHPDRLSTLSDELLIRIVHLLPVECVLICQTVSHRFQRLAGDAQVWKGLYWRRWVRPRVRMLPRVSGEGSREEREALSWFSSRKSKWLDEGRNGVGVGKSSNGDTSTDWKARYKLRHNWSIGAAEVREIDLGFGFDPIHDATEDDGNNVYVQGGNTLMARLVDGGIVTVDVKEGLRAWDLQRRECIAQCPLTGCDDDGRQHDTFPTCISIDSGSESSSDTAVVVGFNNGGFVIWKLHFDNGQGTGDFKRQYQSPLFEDEKVDDSKDVQLNAVAYAHPYVLTIAAHHILCLYVFMSEYTIAGKDAESLEHSSIRHETCKKSEASQSNGQRDFEDRRTESGIEAPRLLTSLKSHTCWPPLCLSIRSTPQTIIASIAYAHPTYLSGWSVGLQELHLSQSGTILRSRLASAVEQGFHSLSTTSSPSTPLLSQTLRPLTPDISDSPRRSNNRSGRQTHHTSLSYSHPYLLAGNRDNTLSLYLVTSNNEELKISKSTTLWGHTSSVSGAHVGGRGKAVSVSARGEEIRVWELEGGLGRKVVQERSVLVRRESKVCNDGEVMRPEREPSHDGQRRGWVGFNDEVVIVMKERSEGEQTLVVYDFT